VVSRLLKNPKKTRYLALRAKGTGTVEAADLVGISRQTAWRWSKEADAPKAPPKAGVPNDRDIGPTHGDPRPPGSPGAKGQPRDRGPLRERSSLRETLEHQVATGVLETGTFDLDSIDAPVETSGPDDPGSFDRPPILALRGGGREARGLMIQGERRTIERSFGTPASSQQFPAAATSGKPGSPVVRHIRIDESSLPDMGWGSL